MSRFLDIRRVLCLTQEEMAEIIGCTQSNISFLDRGQSISPSAAQRLIDAARGLGVKLTFDHVYGHAKLPPARVVSEGAQLRARDWSRLCASLKQRGWTPVLLSSRFGMKVSVLSDLFRGEIEDPPHALGAALIHLDEARAVPGDATAQTA